MLEDFENWLGKNLQRFRCKPMLFEKSGDCAVFKFDRAVPELSFVLWEDGASEVRVIFRGRHWDTLEEFDLYEAVTADGHYYCDACIERKLYETAGQLRRQHIYEPLLKWCNGHLLPSNRLCIFHSHGASWATIEAETSMESASRCEGFVLALAVERP